MFVINSLNARKRAVKEIKDRPCHVFRTLVVRDGTNGKVEAKAKGEGLMSYICQFDFVYSVILLDTILSKVD